MASLKLLVKLSAAFNYYKKLPFTMEEFLTMAKHCLSDLSEYPQLAMEAHVDYGIILLNLQRPDEALTYFDKVLHVDENVKKAINEKAESLKLMGYYDEAFDLITDSLQRFPLDSYFLNNLATILEKQDHVDAAMDVIDLSLSVETHNWLSHFYRGRILFNLGEFEEALPYFVDAIALFNEEDFRVVDIYNYLSETLLELKRYKEAEQLFQDVVKHFPKRAEGYYHQAEFYFMIGKERQALKLINQAIHLAPPRPDYLQKKAGYLVYLNLADDALQVLQDALELSPEDLPTLDLMGEIFYNMGRYEDAIEVYEKRLEVEHFELTYYHLANCYFKIDDFTNALRSINRFIQLDAAYYLAFLLRAKINAVTQYHKLALDDLHKALELADNELVIYDSDLYYLETLSEYPSFQNFLANVSIR